jgi:hypothetical protein
MITVDAIVLCALLVAASAPLEQAEDAAIMLTFQRAADSYAFGHRSDERRGVQMEPAQEGRFFTPLVADAFRRRIRTATRNEACAQRVATSGALVPRVNTAPVGALAVPECVAAALPPLPDELEYKMASVALLLVDAHRQVIVDVLHAAFTIYR